MLLLFTEIPFSVIESFHARTLSRANKLRQTREMHLKGEAVSFDQISYDYVEEHQSGNGQLTQDAPKIEKNKNRNERSKTITESSGWSKRHWTLLKISSIIALCVIYFVVTYWIEFGSIQTSLVSGGATVNWGQYRMTQFLIAMNSLRSLSVQVFFSLAMLIFMLRIIHY